MKRQFLKILLVTSITSSAFANPSSDIGVSENLLIGSLVNRTLILKEQVSEFHYSEGTYMGYNYSHTANCPAYINTEIKEGTVTIDFLGDLGLEVPMLAKNKGIYGAYNSYDVPIEDINQGKIKRTSHYSRGSIGSRGSVRSDQKFSYKHDLTSSATNVDLLYLFEKRNGLFFTLKPFGEALRAESSLRIEALDSGDFLTIQKYNRSGKLRDSRSTDTGLYPGTSYRECIYTDSNIRVRRGNSVNVDL